MPEIDKNIKFYPSKNYILEELKFLSNSEILKNIIFLSLKLHEERINR